MNNNINNNNKLLLFWEIYDEHGINKALEWLEINKYNENIDNNCEIDELNFLIKNVQIQ